MKANVLFRMWWTIALLGLALGTHAAKPPRRLGVSVGATSITVERATAGGQVLLVGHELTRRDYQPVYRRVVREATALGDRSVRFEIGRDVAPNSFWVAFDLASGAYGAESPSKRALREAELPDRLFQRDTDGKSRKIEARLDFVYALTIRPGVGVWELTAGDGGGADDDRSPNGKIQISAGRLSGIAKTTSAAGEFRAGDVIAVFAPHRMAYLITEVKR